MNNRGFTGSEPGVGSFDCRIDSIGQEWCIFVVTTKGQRYERYCSTWQNKPCKGLTRVYEILRTDFGFTIDRR